MGGAVGLRVGAGNQPTTNGVRGGRPTAPGRHTRFGRRPVFGQLDLALDQHAALEIEKRDGGSLTHFNQLAVLPWHPRATGHWRQRAGRMAAVGAAAEASQGVHRQQRVSQMFLELHRNLILLRRRAVHLER